MIVIFSHLIAVLFLNSYVMKQTCIQAMCEGDSAVLCDKLADSISASMGGTSGALLEIFFRAAATFLSTKVL